MNRSPENWSRAGEFELKRAHPADRSRTGYPSKRPRTRIWMDHGAPLRTVTLAPDLPDSTAFTKKHGN